MKFISWNIDGANAVLRKSSFTSLLLMWNADIYAFQETKVMHRDLRITYPGYHDYWSFYDTCRLSSPQSGTLVLSRRKAKRVITSFEADPDFDTEGRLIALEFDHYYFVNVYVPNTQDAVAGKRSKKSMQRREYRARFDRLFREFVCKLNDEKTVVICGDFNAAISSMDMSENSRWQDGNGFSKDECAQLRRLTEVGFTDTYRYKYPKEKEAYTHWSIRDEDHTRGNGRRLDYFFVSNDLAGFIHDANIFPNIKGSDHYPIYLKLDMSQPVIRNEKIFNLTYEDMLQREASGVFFYSLKDVDLTHAWETIDWDRAEEHLREMQRHIAIIARTFDPEKIRNAQFTLVSSLDAKLLTVRKVVSSKKHAGKDGVRWVTANEKMHAAISLTSKDYIAMASIARDTTDKKGKMRRFNVDTYYDTAMQVLYGFSLAPVQETWSDRKSFANRKCRNTTDANYFICKTFSGPDAPLWAVKTDVKKCYESLDHDWIRNHIPMALRVIDQFLQAGYFLSDEYYDMDHGIGLGSRLSPYLANMSMDGLQDHIYYNLHAGGEPIDKKNGDMVRFADDIIVAARDQHTAFLILHYIRDFLGERGLILSDEKTEVLYIPRGFDYLGRHYEKKGDRIIASPSEASVTRFKNDVEEFVLGSSRSPESLVEELNYKISRFASYHKMTDAWDAFREIDAHICACLLKLCDRTFGEDKREKYFKDNWIRSKRGMQFVVKGAPHKRVILMQDTIPTTFRPIPLNLNPYIDYEKIHKIRGRRDMENVVGKYKPLWERQKGCCEYCRKRIWPDDEKEVVEVDSTARKFVDRMAYIHSRCRDMVFKYDYKDPEYESEDNTLKMILELSDEYKLEGAEDNLLYQYFKNAEKRTIRLSFKQIEEMSGMELGAPAKHREFWVQNADDKLCYCWHANNYYFMGFTTKNRNSVTFRKIEFFGETMQLDIYDYLLYSEIPVRTGYKLQEAIRQILEQDGLPTY